MIETIYQAYLACNGICTDSRACQEGIAQAISLRKSFLNKLCNKGSEAFLLNLYFTYLTGLIFLFQSFIGNKYFNTKVGRATILAVVVVNNVIRTVSET